MTVQFSSNTKHASIAARMFIACNGEVIFDTESLVMDLCAADGCNGNAPIDWDKLLAADDTTLMHDVGGIQRHMDRETGSLGHFLPRCAEEAIMLRKKATIYLSHKLTEEQRDHAIRAVAEEQFSNSALNGVCIRYERSSRGNNTVIGLPRDASMQVLAAIDQAGSA